MTDIEILRGGEIKAGDTKPMLRLKLLEDGSAYNLDGHTAKVTIKRTGADSPVVDSSIPIDDTDRGILTYEWSSGETDEAGTYEIEVVATSSSNEITFPNSGHARLYIGERLA